MKQVLKRLRVYLVSLAVILMLVLLYLLYKSDTDPAPEYPSFDISEIRHRGYLVAALEQNSTDYYIYKGRPQGFQLDLLRKFTEKIKIPLRIIVENDRSKALEMLFRGQCDIIAAHIPVEKNLRENFTFTEPLFTAPLVLVHHFKTDSTGPHPESVSELLHHTIHLPGYPFISQRLEALSNEIGDSIPTVIHAGASYDYLLRSTARRETPYTILPYHIARIGTAYYPQLTLSFPVSFDQNYAWLIRRNTPELRFLLNNWMDEIKNNNSFDAIFYKYFRSDRQARVFRSDSCSLNSNTISPYDDAIRAYSRMINWDWRLLASLIYQESKFNNDTSSRRGAYGIMQLMPITAQRFGVDSASSPEEHIKAGVMYIKWLDAQLKSRVNNNSERIKFILAAYNVGLGHIYDAQALAAKHGKNPEVWDGHVDFFLLNKSNPFYRDDTLIRNGSIKGRETYALVIKVMERYHHYKNLIK